jgi:hypothetical protein
MGESSGAAPEIFEGFQQPTNPETLTPNFGQISGVGSGQPAPGFEGFPMPNGFSEFFTPGMPTMMSSPYIPSGQSGGAPQPQASSPAASPAPATPDMVSMFGGAPASSMAAQPPSMGSAMFDTQPQAGGPGIGPGGQQVNPFQTQAAIRAGAGAQLAGLPFAMA